MAEFKFEIMEHIGVLSESSKGWTKELNLISWNGKEPKYDLILGTYSVNTIQFYNNTK